MIRPFLNRLFTSVHLALQPESIPEKKYIIIDISLIPNNNSLIPRDDFSLKYKYSVGHASQNYKRLQVPANPP